MKETGKKVGFQQDGLSQNNYKGMCVVPFRKQKELSAKATGILYYLLSKPDGWRGQMFDIRGHFKDGSASIRSGVKELCDAGYLERVFDYDDGKFCGSHYKIYEKPRKR